MAPQSKLQSKPKELELEANAMISSGGKVSVAVLPYEEASKLCDGVLPDYIPKVSQIQTKKGMTKVFYTVGS
ncbi:hypothetical protein Q3G72_025014 [Acer saccharum]|nr:hypothetical protein Q3G72_025014 [Acer saccharum]